MRKHDGPTLKQLRLLVVVSRTHSLGAAARKLGVTQSALSQGARDLEERCRFELFDRSFYNTYLSGDGMKVVTQARRVLDEYECLLDMIAKIAQRRRARM